MDDYKIVLGSILDANAKDDINAQLNGIKDLSVMVSKANLSQEAINDIKRQLTQNGIDLNLVFGNVSQITNQAKQTGQQIGNIISDEVNNALGKVTSKEIGIGFTVEKTTSDEFNNAVDEEIRKLQQANNKLNSVRYTTNTERQEVTDIFGNVDYEHVEKLTGAVFRYNTETGEAITKTMKWAQIGMTVDNKGNDVPLMGWVQGLTTYNKSLDESSVKTDTFVDKQKTAVTNLSNQLATIESKFNSSKKPLSDIYDIAQVENKIFDVRKAIDTLSASSKDGFIDAKNAVTTEITELNNLITTLQNAEYAATSLRTKDIKTVKTDEENNLNTFVEKMKQSGHYTEKLEQDVANLRSQLNSVFDANTLTLYLNGLSNLQSEFKSVDATAKTAENAIKIQTNVEAEKKILTLYKNELKEAGVLTGDVKQKIQDMFYSLSKVDSQNGLTTWRAALKGVKAETDAVLKSVQSSSAKEHEIQLRLDDGTYEAKIADLKAKTQQWTDANGEARISVKELEKAYDSLVLSKTDEDKIANAKKLDEAIKSTTNSIKKMNAEYAKDSSVNSLKQKIQEFYDKNTASHARYGKELRSILDELSANANISKSRLDEIEQEFIQIGNAARQTGKLGKSFFDSIKEQASKFVQWFSMTSVVMEGVQAIKKMTQEVIAVDSAMIELRKVSNASNNELKNYFDKSAESAKDLGATVSDVINATADWSRLGYSLPDSKKLAEIATLYKNVGDGIDIDTANQSLVSTLQGFKLDTEDAMHIIDSFNEVANNYAIDSAGIGEALQRSASSMYAAGNTLEETIGLVTAANAVVQDPDSIGTAYKTISMRIRGAKTEMEQLGLETDGMVESTATLQKEILALTGVDIMKDKNTFKSTYAILDELATKWSDLTDIQQASVTELIAGKRQGNIVSALMTNFDTAREATQTAVESQGSALREQENYEKGIQYSLDRLSASWQEFSNHFLDSSFIKGIIDFGNTSINVIDDITSALGSLGTIGVIGGGILGAKNAGICV